jgi:tetratricopeptide (TPR) repeat protein
MSSDLKTLERQAVELAIRGDFGTEAIRINLEIVALAPKQESAWTRLGRSYLEQQNFDEAIDAFRTALGLNPANRVATNLLTELRRRRALKPSTITRAATGFGVREFTLLETMSADAACEALKPRIEALFDTINATTIARRIVEARQKHGARGSLLFQANNFYPGGTGHMFAFHHGGRWEPQFNMGWFSSPPLPCACFRVGLGFNLTGAGRDPHPEEGQQRVLKSFEQFQRLVSQTWKHELIQWMTASGGFIQYDEQPPARDFLPEKAVEWLINSRNAAALGWVFCGRWLFLDRADDAALLSDRSKLARVVEDAFRTLYPIWLNVYTASIE